MPQTPDAKKNTTPRIVCRAPWRLTKVEPLADYKLEVEFVDGTKGIVDLSSRVQHHNGGVFTALKETHLFNEVFLENGAVTWPGEIDLAPDAMHDEIQRNGHWVL